MMRQWKCYITFIDLSPPFRGIITNTKSKVKSAQARKCVKVEDVGVQRKHVNKERFVQAVSKGWGYNWLANESLSLKRNREKYFDGDDYHRGTKV